MKIVQEMFWDLLGELAIPALLALGFIVFALLSCFLLIKIEKKRRS